MKKKPSEKHKRSRKQKDVVIEEKPKTGKVHGDPCCKVDFTP